MQFCSKRRGLVSCKRAPLHLSLRHVRSDFYGSSIIILYTDYYCSRRTGVVLLFLLFFKSNRLLVIFARILYNFCFLI